MFFTRTKTRLGDAISELAAEIVAGRVVSTESCRSVCTHDEGATWLYTETVIHLLHAAAFVGSREYGRRLKWADGDFFLTHISKGIRAAGIKDADHFEAVVLRGLLRNSQMRGTGPARVQLMYEASAAIVQEHDPDVRSYTICGFLDRHVTDFLNGDRIRAFGALV